MISLVNNVSGITKNAFRNHVKQLLKLLQMNNNVRIISLQRTITHVQQSKEEDAELRLIVKMLISKKLVLQILKEIRVFGMAPFANLNNAQIFKKAHLKLVK